MIDIPMSINLEVHAFKAKEPDRVGKYLVWIATNWVEVIELLWSGEWHIPECSLFTKQDLKKALYWAHLPTIQKGIPDAKL